MFEVVNFLWKKNECIHDSAVESEWEEEFFPGMALNWLSQFQTVSPEGIFIQVTLRNWEGWAYVYVQVNDIEKEQRGAHGDGN